MLYIDVLRGDDATGVCMVTKEQGALVLKEATEAYDYLRESKVEAMLKSSTNVGKALLGHNRKATVGGPKDANAHPFCFDDRYVFFHNGTLNGHKHLEDTDVDSEALGKHLTACEGDADKIADVFAKVNGAWACVWYDSVKHTVYFTRNAQRPLSLLKTKGGDWAYASEAWMAAGALARNTMIVDSVKSLDADVLYSIDLTKTNLELAEEKLPKKAPVTTSNTRGTVASTAKGVNLSRKAAHILLKTLQNQPGGWCGFFVDDVTCAHEKPNAHQVYDFLLMGTHPEYPGVTFKSLVKDLYPYEAEEMVAEYTYGKYYESSYYRGQLSVTLTDVIKQNNGACV